MVEPARVPTIFLSAIPMVADHPREPTASWGQILPLMLDDGVAVANMRKARGDAQILPRRPAAGQGAQHDEAGRLSFIQFGHNDQKAQWPQTYAEAGTTYRAYLAAYIAEARRRGRRQFWSPARKGAISIQRVGLPCPWAIIRRPCARSRVNCKSR
jgi:hypothetical protein